VAKSDLTRPTDATIKRLFARSGNRCAFPKCTGEIVLGDTLVGKICHIKAARPGGPRYDPNQTAAERHGYDNLILLCGTHHTVIDDDEEAYTVDRLVKMKIDHEQTATPLPDDRTASGTQLLIDQSVSAINQSGGIAAHTVNIYAGQPSAPSAQPSTPQPAPFPKAEPKDGPARFRPAGEPIGNRWDQIPISTTAEQPTSLAAGPAIWLRLMPMIDPGKHWPAYELRERAVRTGSFDLQPFVVNGIYPLRAEDGVGICSLMTPDTPETTSVAFAFETGEVWSIDTTILAYSLNDLPFLETYYNERLKDYARFLAGLGLKPPYHWIAGVTGAKGRRLQRPPPPGQMWIPGWPGPQCLSDTVRQEGEYDGEQTPSAALYPFFKAIFDACGIPRPDYLSS